MKKRTPEEWVAAIESLPESIRRAVAKIVWWDFFGGRLNGKRWDHLDKYVQTPLEDIPDDLMLEGLQLVGFTESQARQRIFPEERLTICNQNPEQQDTDSTAIQTSNQQPTEIK